MILTRATDIIVDGSAPPETLDMSGIDSVIIAKCNNNLFRNEQIDSENVPSFQGLEHLNTAKFISVNTGKNKRRSLERLTCTHTLQSMSIEYGNIGDYDAISRCISLSNLAIGRGPAPNFKSWSKLPLTVLKFWNYCSFTELEDMAYLSKLSNVMIGACQKFERFRGDNSL